MTTYDGNISVTDTRKKAPLAGVLDRVFATPPGAALKSRIKGCRGKTLTVEYKKASRHRDIRTDTNDNECLTKLSVGVRWVIDDFPKSWRDPSANSLGYLGNELKKMKTSSGLKGTTIAARGGKGRIPEFKWTYPIPRKALTKLFDELLDGTKNLYEAGKALSPHNPRGAFDWSLKIGIDLHRVFRRKLTRGNGGNATIIFDEEYAGGNLGRSGDGNDKKKIAAVVLAHELVHAYMALTGAGMESGFGILEDYYVIGLNRRPRPYCENNFRTAFALPKRTAI